MAWILRAFRATCVAIGFIWLTVTLLPITKWMATGLAGNWPDAKGDVLVVLGGDGPNTGMIGMVSYWRAVYAVRVWREGGFRTAVVSGGGGISDTIGAFLVCEQIPASAIILETQSTSTRENVANLAPILRKLPGKKVFVTSDFHVYRSARLFRQAGIDISAQPFPYALKRSNAYLDRFPVFLELCVEVGKIVRDWVWPRGFRGWD